MFKRKGGEGQRPFEQCSKKLHFSLAMASLTLMATYTTSSSLSWRNDKTGDLPLSKYGLIGTVQLLTTSSMLVVACMTTMSFTILFWDPVQELWTKARDPDVP